MTFPPGWHVETPEYRFIFHSNDGDYCTFYGITNKHYGERGGYYQLLHVANNVIADSMVGLTVILSEMMRDAVNEAVEYYAIGEGD